MYHASMENKKNWLMIFIQKQILRVVSFAQESQF